MTKIILTQIIKGHIGLDNGSLVGLYSDNELLISPNKFLLYLFVVWKVCLKIPREGQGFNKEKSQKKYKVIRF